MPESDGVAFAQRSRGQQRNVNKIEDWMKYKECYKCVQKGQIATVCPTKKNNSDLDSDGKRKIYRQKRQKERITVKRRKKKPNSSSKNTMNKMKSPTITDLFCLGSAL